MKRKKVIYGILLAAIIIFILYVYNGFNGNPISQYASKKVLEKYLVNTYPDKTLRVQDGKYDFKFSDYMYKVIDIGDGTDKKQAPAEYEFRVRGSVKFRISYDSLRIANIDQELSRKLGDQAAEEINNLFSQKINSIKDVSVNAEVNKGQYDSSISWSKDLKLNEPMGMHIIIDATNMGREDVYNAVVKIKDILAEGGYDYSIVNINANVMQPDTTKKDRFGYVKYSLAFKKDAELKISNIKETKK